MNINAALGMTSERPLQVGDWVELLPSGRGMAYLDFATWPKQIIAVANDGFVRFDEINGPWNCNRFRRVNPPRERDEVAELREQDRILNEICDDIRDTFGYSRDDMVDLTTYVAQDYAQLREQLERMTKERDCVYERIDFLNRQLTWMRDAERLLKASVDAGDTAIRQLEQRCEVAEEERDEAVRNRIEINKMVSRLERERDTLREQLATEQAEAAAMREAINRLPDYRDIVVPYGDPGHVVSNALIFEIKRSTNTTAGRELLDEMRRKDAEIEKIHNARTRETRKARTAKLAYAETLRGKIDESWFGEQSPVWRYRGHVNGALWRTCDGRMIEYEGGKGLGIWDKSGVYIDWNDLLNNTATYPCDEHGKRIEEQSDMDVLEGMVEIFKVDEERERDAELCRELRAWVKNGVFSVVGYSLVIGCQCVPAELAELLVSIRDGGAK